MIDFVERLEKLSLYDKCFFLDDILTCFTEYLLSDKAGAAEFSDDDSFITIFPDKVKYFKEIDDGLFKSKEYDIEFFMSIIYDKSRAIIKDLDEELARLDKSDDVMSKIDTICVKTCKKSLKSSLGEFETAYGRSDFYGIVRSL